MLAWIPKFVKAHLFLHLIVSIYRNPYLFLCFSIKISNLYFLLVRKEPNNLVTKLGKGHFSFLRLFNCVERTIIRRPKSVWIHNTSVSTGCTSSYQQKALDIQHEWGRLDYTFFSGTWLCALWTLPCEKE